jgi:glycosyltransferase involved in cell wall biosynthesis
MKLLIFSPSPTGGLAEHAHYQARAFHGSANRSGTDLEKPKAEVTLLCSPDFLDGRKVKYKKAAVFSSDFSFFGRFVGRAGELLDKSLKIIGEQWRLALEVLLRKPDVVLLSSYSEYLAPFWVLPHWIFAKILGVVYVANLHDPVRDYVLGPKWWHDLSVKMAYWPISVGVVHQRLPEPSPVPKHVLVVEAPVGVYDLQESPENPEAIRAAWGVRKEKSETLKLGKAESRNSADCGNALDSGRSSLDTSAHADVVFLAFGFIRDNKNLNLVIRALVENPSAVLVVMGRAQSKKDKPLEFYRNLAAELGVQDRVNFFDGFVPDEKLSSYFAAADVVVLTYDASFHSQSGVLNVAARARRPVLASAGESPLKDCVQRFRLGVFVEPDDSRALEEGMKMAASVEWRVSSGEPNWEGYEAFASWDVNVAKILEGVEEVRRTKL